MLEALKDPKVLIIICSIIILGGYIIGSFRRYQKSKNNVYDTQKQITKGSKVILSAGIYGTVKKVGKVSCEVEIAKGIVVEVDRFAIGKVLNEKELLAKKEFEKKEAKEEKEQKEEE